MLPALERRLRKFEGAPGRHPDPSRMTPTQRATEIDRIQAQLVRSGDWPAGLPCKPAAAMTSADRKAMIAALRASVGAHHAT